MKSRSFDRRMLTEQLSVLDRQHQVAFAAACAERLVPYYEFFSKSTRWGSVSALQSALSLAWTFARGDEVNEASCLAAAAACDLVTPDSEQFRSPIADRARDAATAAAQTAELCADTRAELAAEVGEMAYDAAFGAAQFHAATAPANLSVADPAYVNEIRKAANVEDELEFQRRLLAELQRAPSGRVDVDSLRSRIPRG